MVREARKIKRIDCRKCAFFYVTWDKRFPWGCKSFGFKTRKMPYLDVYQSSGAECQLFTLKNK